MDVLDLFQARTDSATYQRLGELEQKHILKQSMSYISSFKKCLQIKKNHINNPLTVHSSVFYKLFLIIIYATFTANPLKSL